MKKIFAFLLVCLLLAACASLVACTNGKEAESESGHNIIIDDDENNDPENSESDTVNSEWELDGVPLG